MADERYTLQPTSRADWLVLLVPLIVVAFGYAWYFWGDVGPALGGWAVPYSTVCVMVACFGLAFIVRDAWTAFRHVAFGEFAAARPSPASTSDHGGRRR